MAEYTHKELLSEETEYFESHDKEFLRKYEDKHLLIHGAELIGVFDDEDQAVLEGIRRFGKGPFLVRQPGEPEIILEAPAYSLGLL